MSYDESYQSAEPSPGLGHNTAAEHEAIAPEVGGIAADRLKSLVSRIERLEEEKKALSSDIKDIFSEAKASGFSVPVLKTLLRQRKMEPAEVEEQENLMALYRQALGL